MKTDFEKATREALIAIVIIFGLVFWWVSCNLVSKDEAVKAGVAEYYLDTDHNKRFRWLTNQVKGQQ